MTTIIGNNQCHSPYSGTEPITIKRTGLPTGTWVGFGVPTNFVPSAPEGITVATEAIGYVQADAVGAAQMTFNASPTEDLVTRTAQNGWVLPVGSYNVSTWAYDASNPQTETAQIQVIGNASTSIAKATANKSKKK